MDSGGSGLKIMVGPSERSKLKFFRDIDFMSKSNVIRCGSDRGSSSLLWLM